MNGAELASTSMKTLSEVYHNREIVANQWRNQGKKVVGCMGNDVIEEILIAGGFLPVRIYGSYKLQLDKTDKYLEYAFDPVVRSQFEKLIDGTYFKQLDFLAISNSTDVLIRTYFYLKEIKRIEPDLPVPPLYFIDLLFTRYRMHQVANRNAIVSFKKTVETWSGKEISDESLEQAINICNENRKLLRRVQDLREADKPKLSGVDAIKIIGSSLFMEREEHTKLLKNFLEEANNFPEIEGPRIFVIGSVHEDTDFYEMIEKRGAVVIGEDHDWGNRHFDMDVEENSNHVNALVDRYMLRSPSSKKSFVHQRVEALRKQITKAKPDGVVFFLRKYDDAPSWEFSEQAKILEENDIPCLFLVNQPYDLSKSEDASTKLDVFIEKLKK